MTPNPWLPFKRGHVPARLRLVCLPFAGGGASFYRPWLDALPGVEVLPVQPPGREGRFREPAFDRLPTLVSAIADAITPIPGPFALFGHSLGALVAFELAREFRWRGSPMPTMLIVSGRAAPQLPPRFPPSHALPDTEFLTALKPFGGTPATVLDNIELMQAYLPLLRADFAAHETYSYVDEPPLEIPLMVFGGTHDPRVNRQELDAWPWHPNSTRHVRQFDGDHFYLGANRHELLSELRELARTFAVSVHHGHVNIGLDTALRREEWQLLDEREVARANRFLRERDRIAFVRSRAGLRELLGSFLQRHPNPVTIRLGRGGKPFVDSPNDLRFNISHSHDLFAYAVATGREVGIDVEHVRDDIDHLGLAQRYFHPAEVADILALPPDEQSLGFFRVWTRKEAYVKALGLGLTIPLDGFRVSVGEPARLLSTDHDPSQLGRWSLESLDVPAGYVGALCVEDASQKKLN